MLTITVAATLAGAVCGDHCSPISDTTIMASTGAQCDHINHVSTQLPYALTVAAVSAVNYVLAALIQNWMINLPIAIVSMVVVILAIRKLYGDMEVPAEKYVNKIVYTKSGVTDFGYAVFYIPTERQLGKGVTYAMRDTGMLQSVRVCRGHRG